MKMILGKVIISCTPFIEKRNLEIIYLEICLQDYLIFPQYFAVESLSSLEARNSK